MGQPGLLPPVSQSLTQGASHLEHLHIANIKIPPLANFQENTPYHEEIGSAFNLLSGRDAPPEQITRIINARAATDPIALTTTRIDDIAVDFSQGLGSLPLATKPGEPVRGA